MAVVGTLAADAAHLQELQVGLLADSAGDSQHREQSRHLLRFQQLHAQMRHLEQRQGQSVLGQETPRLMLDGCRERYGMVAAEPNGVDHWRGLPTLADRSLVSSSVMDALPLPTPRRVSSAEGPQGIVIAASCPEEEAKASRTSASDCSRACNWDFIQHNRYSDDTVKELVEYSLHR